MAADELPALPTPFPEVVLEPPRHSIHGDLSCNIAMLLAKPCRQAPLAIAGKIASRITCDEGIARVEIAPPGFLNFRLCADTMLRIVETILSAPTTASVTQNAVTHSVLLEFVSANPTGPLHVGHGRGAAYGAALANLLRAVGQRVTTEYYVNDAGRQMDILALSVWLRYLSTAELTREFPENAYRGAYIHDIANDLRNIHGGRFERSFTLALAAEIADPEARLDHLIAHCRSTLADDYELVHRFACDAILRGISDDLAAFGVTFDNWYSEQSLTARGLLSSALDALEAAGYTFREAGALWFRASAVGDEKDRVLVRENGNPTYFASDVAYHRDKFARGFARAINIWGADHHGYIPRVKAVLQVLGLAPANLDILLVQFASLYRAGQKVQMSTRSGEFVTLRELIDEVGKDAARYFYSSRRSDQHLDFDLDLAKEQSQDNPVYYLQYAHARICSVFRQHAQAGQDFSPAIACAQLALLVEPKETQLTGVLSRYSDVVTNAAASLDPHLVANYLRDLATEYHAYYNTHKILVDESNLRLARLALCAAVRIVLAHGLGLLGVSAPEEM